MIIIKEFPNKAFSTSDEAMKELVTNKKTLIAQKKAAIKEADSIPYVGTPAIEKSAVKAEGETPSLTDATTIKITAVSNACNYYDSHGDVSIYGSWNRTAKNQKSGLHLQEHQNKFDKLISDEVSFTVEMKTWKELGFDYEGSTECLVMHSTAEKETNPFMFDKYVKGKVKNHSSGLMYINMVLAMNNSADWAKEEKEAWDKYYPGIVNKDDVDQRGYFWAVLEQKILENSAVLRGSNPATPTINVEPADSTSAKNENPERSTSHSDQKIFINPNFY